MKRIALSMNAAPEEVDIDRLPPIVKLRVKHGFPSPREAAPKRGSDWSKAILAFDLVGLREHASHAIAELRIASEEAAVAIDGKRDLCHRVAVTFSAMVDAGIIEWPEGCSWETLDLTQGVANALRVDDDPRFPNIRAVVETVSRNPFSEWFRRLTEQSPDAFVQFVRKLGTLPQQLRTPEEREAYLAARNREREEHGLPSWDWVPKNAPLLDALSERFVRLGFSWEPSGRVDQMPDRDPATRQVPIDPVTGRPKTKSVQRRWPTFTCQPAIGGHVLTLADLALLEDDELDLVDGYRENLELGELPGKVGEPAGMEDVITRMNATGVGYKGNPEVSWRAGLRPTELPTAFAAELAALARAVFLLDDAVLAIGDTDPMLTSVLTHRVPPRIPQLRGESRVDVVRPDVVIVRNPDGTFRPVITELESCPAGQGMATAMSHGYELLPDIVDAYVAYLAGRRYIVVATAEWAEYVYDQAVFVRELAQRGVQASLTLDLPLDEVAAVARRWTPPKDLHQVLRERWDADLLGRLRASGLLEFVRGVAPRDLPDSVGDAVVFRFGYYDNFAGNGVLDRLLAWEQSGATIANGLHWAFENKALMAAIGVPVVREWIRRRDEQALGVLNRCVAETRLLREGSHLEDVRRDRLHWILKYGAWDGDNQCWGSRSLAVGAQISERGWQELLDDRLELEHPVVVQHLILGARYAAAYRDHDGALGILRDALPRLTPFFVRVGDDVRVVGSTLTLRAGTFRIHGSSDAVEMPVVFRDAEKGAR